MSKSHQGVFYVHDYSYVHDYMDIGDRMNHDYRDIEGRVTPGAVTEETKSRSRERL